MSSGSSVEDQPVSIGAGEGYLRDYYEHLAEEDARAYPAELLAARAQTHRQTAAHRFPGDANITISDEADRSVVYIVTDDMPFLVDSVNAELVRQNAPDPPRDAPALRRDPQPRERRARQGRAGPLAPGHLQRRHGGDAQPVAPDRPGRQRLAHGVLDRRRNRPRRRREARGADRGHRPGARRRACRRRGLAEDAPPGASRSPRTWTSSPTRRRSPNSARPRNCCAGSTTGTSPSSATANTTSGTNPARTCWNRGRRAAWACCAAAPTHRTRSSTSPRPAGRRPAKSARSSSPRPTPAPPCTAPRTWTTSASRASTRPATSTANAASSDCSPPPPTPDPCVTSRWSAKRSPPCCATPASRRTRTPARTCWASSKPTPATSSSRSKSPTWPPLPPASSGCRNGAGPGCSSARTSTAASCPPSSTCRATGTPPTCACASRRNCARPSTPCPSTTRRG